MDERAIGSLRETFCEMFDNAGDRRYLLVVSPGRTEIAGNHTDHEGGHVIAAAVDRHVTGIFSPSESGVLRVHSEGYGLVAVDASDLEVRADEHGTTTSLVRGMAAQFAERGYEVRGFDAALRSNVLGGSGLSSSAAFELELGQAMNALWADGALTPSELALMAQRTEREWFGKPCGLMDQAAVALGGIQFMDFSDPMRLEAKPLDFDFAKAQFAICIVAVGDDHSANTSDYAAVPAEMQAVAAELGKKVLSQVDERQLVAAIPRLRDGVGDRAVLRSLHYLQEEWLVDKRMEALASGSMSDFLKLTRLSGMSSAMYLQNVSIGGSQDQPSMVAIALAELLLRGSGAVRVHGGGFGGTIQAFVPLEMVDEFKDGMDAVFGSGACDVCNVEHKGAFAQWL